MTKDLVIYGIKHGGLKAFSWEALELGIGMYRTSILGDKKLSEGRFPDFLGAILSDLAIVGDTVKVGMARDYSSLGSGLSCLCRDEESVYLYDFELWENTSFLFRPPCQESSFREGYLKCHIEDTLALVVIFGLDGVSFFDGSDQENALYNIPYSELKLKVKASELVCDMDASLTAGVYIIANVTQLIGHAISLYKPFELLRLASSSELCFEKQVKSVSRKLLRSLSVFADERPDISSLTGLKKLTSASDTWALVRGGKILKIVFDDGRNCIIYDEFGKRPLAISVSEVIDDDKVSYKYVLISGCEINFTAENGIRSRQLVVSYHRAESKLAMICLDSGADEVQYVSDGMLTFVEIMTKWLIQREK